MGNHIDIKPELVDWAIQRARLDDTALQSDIVQRALQWISGQKKPTLAQLNAFAKKVMVPFGYLFLNSPPDEPLPIADFRTFDDKIPHRPSPNLLDTIHEMQARQEWMREDMIADEIGPLEFVGSISREEPIVAAAKQVRENLGLPADWNQGCKNSEDCFQRLRYAADQLGILVFLNGIVGGNTHRPLDHREFRGFVLSDQYAPLVFINGNDTNTARLFTLAHELVHLSLGESGLFNLHQLEAGSNQLEVHCNRIAAEFLVPSDPFTIAWKENPSESALPELAKRFGVSRLVIARRALDHQLITRELFFAYYHRLMEQWNHEKEKKKADGRAGGDYYITKRSRLSRRFSEAVFSAVGAGELLYRDAYNLLGLNGKTFEKYRRLVQEGKNE